MRRINALLGLVGLLALLLGGCGGGVGLAGFGGEGGAGGGGTGGGGGGGGGTSGLATIRGSVLDANNNPVNGATVQVSAGTTVLATATTDAGGNFFVRFAVSGTTSVVVTARSGGQTASTSTVVSPNAETQLVLRFGGTGLGDVLSPPPPPFRSKK